MDSLYHKKYLKYREKYLNLKKQFGGAKCYRCGNESKYCTCPPHLDTLPQELSLDIYYRLDLNGLISLSQTNPMIRKEINLNLTRILLQVIENETSANKEIIQAFLDGTRSNLDMRTISNLIMFKGFLLEIGSYYNGSFNGYNVKIAVASLSSNEMFNLFGYLIKVFKSSNPSGWNLFKSMDKINTVMSHMNLHKANCLVQILEHYEGLGKRLNLLADDIERFVKLHNDDQQFSQLLKYTTNNSMTLGMANFFLQYRLTDAELEQAIIHFKSLGSYNNMDVERYIKKLRGY